MTIPTHFILKKKLWYALDKPKLLGENLCQDKNDNKSCGLFHELFVDPKLNYCVTIDDLGFIQNRKCLNVLQIVKDC